MPYINKETRALLSNGREAETPGELNYLLTKLIIRYQKTKGLSYQTINDIVGALEGCKQEYYRRVAVDYESKKIQENSDVY